MELTNEKNTDFDFHIGDIAVIGNPYIFKDNNGPNSPRAGDKIGLYEEIGYPLQPVDKNKLRDKLATTAKVGDIVIILKTKKHDDRLYCLVSGPNGVGWTRALWRLYKVT